MCTITRLKRLLEKLDAPEEKSLVVYPGTFLRYEETGEIFLVTFYWSPERNESDFGLASLSSGEYYGEAVYVKEGYVQEIDLGVHEDTEEWEVIEDV